MIGVCVFGAGHVGLVTAACLASMGNDVTCYDRDTARIDALRAGAMPFYEPGLDDLVYAERRSGRLRFTADGAEALVGRELVFVAVGTPVGSAGEADLTAVREAARSIATHARTNLVIANKSTVPVETADLVARIVSERRDVTFSVASNPEFLREGSAVHDFMRPERVVIGTADARARAMLERLYAPLRAPMVCVDLRTAEMIKYAANAFLATKLSFVNELANLCAGVGADVDGVVRGMASDSRIGGAFLTPGLGFGGSCLPKDVSALQYVARQHGIEPLLLDAVLTVNRQQVCRAVFALEDELGDLDRRRIALFGVAFKGGTDDVRESPAIALARVLAGKGAALSVTDPRALDGARRELSGAVRFAHSPEQAADGADAVVVATDWPQYTQLSWPLLAKAMRGSLVLDCRRLLDQQSIEDAGLRYRAMGGTARSRARVA